MRRRARSGEAASASSGGSLAADGPGRSGAREGDSIAESLDRLDPVLLRKRWRSAMGRSASASLSRQLMIRILLWRGQVDRAGDIDARTRAILAAALAGDEPTQSAAVSAAPRPGSVLVRQHGGAMHRVMVLEEGFGWSGQTYASLSSVAQAITGTNWNGRRFFGLDKEPRGDRNARSGASSLARTG